MQAGGGYQNCCWVASTAKAGIEDGAGLIGGSAIIAPTGEIIAQCLPRFSATVDPSLFDPDTAQRRRHYHFSSSLKRLR